MISDQEIILIIFSEDPQCGWIFLDSRRGALQDSVDFTGLNFFSYIWYPIVLSSKDFYLCPIQNFILSLLYFVYIAQDIKNYLQCIL